MYNYTAFLAIIDTFWTNTGWKFWTNTAYLEANRSFVMIVWMVWVGSSLGLETQSELRIEKGPNLWSWVLEVVEIVL